MTDQLLDLLVAIGLPSHLRHAVHEVTFSCNGSVKVWHYVPTADGSLMSAPGVGAVLTTSVLNLEAA